MVVLLKSSGLTGNKPAREPYPDLLFAGTLSNLRPRTPRNLHGPSGLMSGVNFIIFPSLPDPSQDDEHYCACAAAKMTNHAFRRVRESFNRSMSVVYTGTVVLVQVQSNGTSAQTLCCTTRYDYPFSETHSFM